ncbi:MAG: hypothetical protein ACRDRO_15710 [Pseudonocardiaceae bacterium]
MLRDPVVLVAVIGAVRLVCQTSVSLAVLSGERTRARALVGVLRVCGPGSAIVDRRAGGATLAVRIGRWTAADRGSSGVWGE